MQIDESHKTVKKTIWRIRSIRYHFLWGGWKGACWEKVTCTKENGRLGIQDFMAIDKSETIRDAISL